MVCEAVNQQVVNDATTVWLVYDNSPVEWLVLLSGLADW